MNILRPKTINVRCEFCGAVLPPPTAYGRPRRFCDNSDRCSLKFWRDRRAVKRGLKVRRKNMIERYTRAAAWLEAEEERRAREAEVIELLNGAAYALALDALAHEYLPLPVAQATCLAADMAEGGGLDLTTRQALEHEATTAAAASCPPGDHRKLTETANEAITRALTRLTARLDSRDLDPWGASRLAKAVFKLHQRRSSALKAKARRDKWRPAPPIPPGLLKRSFYIIWGLGDPDNDPELRQALEEYPVTLQQLQKVLEGLRSLPGLSPGFVAMMEAAEAAQREGSQFDFEKWLNDHAGEARNCKKNQQIEKTGGSDRECT